MDERKGVQSMRETRAAKKTVVMSMRLPKPPRFVHGPSSSIDPRRYPPRRRLRGTRRIQSVCAFTAASIRPASMQFVFAHSLARIGPFAYIKCARVGDHVIVGVRRLPDAV